MSPVLSGVFDKNLHRILRDPREHTHTRAHTQTAAAKRRNFCGLVHTTTFILFTVNTHTHVRTHTHFPHIILFRAVAGVVVVVVTVVIVASSFRDAIWLNTSARARSFCIWHRTILHTHTHVYIHAIQHIYVRPYTTDLSYTSFFCRVMFVVYLCERLHSCVCVLDGVRAIKRTRVTRVYYIAWPPPPLPVVRVTLCVCASAAAARARSVETHTLY